jgi:DNA-binding transcriptional ArsR family regulator
MADPLADLITHPMRSRILTTLMGRKLTVGQIAQLLPDVPLPSLYRHLRLLVENEVVGVVDEVRVNGALTRVYAALKGKTIDAQELTAAEHLRAFTTFLNTLSETFRAYMEQSNSDPASPYIHAMMGPLHLSPDEYREFCRELSQLLEKWQGLPMESERQRLIFAHLSLPDRKDPPLT